MIRYCVMMDYRANPLRILKTADYGLWGFAHNTVCKPRSAKISMSLITWEKTTTLGLVYNEFGFYEHPPIHVTSK